MSVAKTAPMLTRPSLYVEIDAQRDALDAVLADVEGGIRDHHHYDTIEERIDRIATCLKKSLRGRR